MNYFKVITVGIFGNCVTEIEVECVQQRRLPALQILGGPPGSSISQRERVMAALENCGFRLPARKITVNLGANTKDFRAEDTDLAVATAILGSMKAFPAGKLPELLACAALSLDGRLLPLSNRSLLRPWLAKQTHRFALFSWEDSQILQENGLGGGFHTLPDLISFLRSGQETAPRKCEEAISSPFPDEKCWQKLTGRPIAQRIAQIAAAGGHSLLMIGEEEGVSRCIWSLLPALSLQNRDEIRARYRQCGLKWDESRPYRRIRPGENLKVVHYDRRSNSWGELSLAHGGVLALPNLESRAPAWMQKLNDSLKAGILRAFTGGRMISQEISLVLLASISGCGCGAGEGGAKICHCSVAERMKRQSLISAMSRNFDLVLVRGSGAESEDFSSFADARQKVDWARRRQEDRQGKLNFLLDPESVTEVQRWSQSAQSALKALGRSGNQDTAAKVALTICDLRNGEEVNRADVLEARFYTSLGSFSSGSGIIRSSTALLERNSSPIP